MNNKFAEKSFSPNRIISEYEAGKRFNIGIDLYDNVNVNENFFIGKQWEGVKSNGLPTPVFNFLKRVVLFSVSNVSTDNLKLNAKPMSGAGKAPAPIMELYASIINDQFSAIFEKNKMGGIIREFCRDAAVDGDGCMYTYWDENCETGQKNKGGIKTEIISNTQVLFGNPNSKDVQSQPHIILERRMMLKEARHYAEKNGCKEAYMIQADHKESGNITIDALGGEKVTVLLKMAKNRETGTVWCSEVTRSGIVMREPWDLGIRLYPITWMPWDFVQDSYHGQAMITGLIPNQIFVNKLFAMSMISLMTLAFPKIVYDKTKIPKWSAKVGAAIGVNGGVDGVAKIMDPASISPQISQFIDTAISYTQKFLGASDVALGDTRPDNTSAIIALQRAAATPMELTKQNLLECVERQGEIYMEFMAEYYGKRYVEIDNGLNGKMIVEFDFTTLKSVPCAIDLDAGPSSYWSEIANMQTLDNLLMQGKIPVSEYLRRVPNGMITDRDNLIAIMEAAEQGQMVNVTTDMMPADENASAPTQDAAPVRGGAGYSALQRIINETGNIPEKVV